MRYSWNNFPCHFDNCLLHFLNLSSIIQKSENHIFFGRGYHHRLLLTFQVSASLVHTLHIIQTNDTSLYSLPRCFCCSIHHIAFWRYGNIYWIEHDIRCNQVLEKNIIQNKYDIMSSREFKCIRFLHFL